MIKQLIEKLIQKYGKKNLIISVFVIFFLFLMLIPSVRYLAKYYLFDILHSQTKYFFETGVKYEEKGYITYSIGSFKRALREKDNKFNINPNDLYQYEALFNLGVMYYTYKKQYPQALHYFNQYIDLCEQKGIINPHEKQIYEVVNFILGMDDSTKNPKAKEMKNKGNEAYFKKEFKIALDYYKTALNMDPSYIEVYNNIATIYYELNDFKSAVEYWKLTLLFDPEELDLYLNIALAYETKLNNNKDALKYYEKLMNKLSPNDQRYNAIKNKITELKAKKSS